MSSSNNPDPAERLVAVNEIHAVIYRYANSAREDAPLDQMAKLFHVNGVFRLPNGMILSPRDLAGVIQGESARYIRHHVTTVDIDFKSRSEARVTTSFFAITDTSSFDYWGRWEDTFIQGEDGCWLIDERSVIVDGSDPKGWYFGKYGL